jgi:hypothetical protein
MVSLGGCFLDFGGAGGGVSLVRAAGLSWLVAVGAGVVVVVRVWAALVSAGGADDHGLCVWVAGSAWAGAWFILAACPWEDGATVGVYLIHDTMHFAHEFLKRWVLVDGRQNIRICFCEILRFVADIKVCKCLDGEVYLSSLDFLCHIFISVLLVSVTVWLSLGGIAMYLCSQASISSSISFVSSFRASSVRRGNLRLGS